MAKAKTGERRPRTEAQALNDAIGGRIAIRGFLYQLLSSFDAGLQAVVRELELKGGDVSSVQLILEPLDGGDHQLSVGAIRIVEQLKVRTTGAAWTTGDIADEVLPDLLRAVDTSPGVRTIYRFSTNATTNCAPLLELGKLLAGRERFDDLPDALDDEDARFLYGQRLTAKAFFKRLATRAKAPSDEALGRVLAGVSIRSEITEAKLTEQIENVLRVVLDYQEQAESKRHELTNRLAELALSGERFKMQSFLAMSGVQILRLGHVGKLVTALHEHVGRHASQIGYNPQADVRAVRTLDSGSAVTVVRGESGYGKSWVMSALAQREISEHRLAVISSHLSSVEDLNRLIAEKVWLTSYDHTLPLPALARRLGGHFGDHQGYWLTAFVDDVQDFQVAKRLVEADWAASSVRLVLSCQPEVAERVLVQRPDAGVLDVAPFSPPELDALLTHHQRRASALPVDVFRLLRTPIFAKLYLDLEGDGWLPTNEYALVDRFWRDKTLGGDMADHEDDLVDLRALSLTLLEPQAHYPWPAAVAKAHGVTDGVRQRLQTCGLMRRTIAGSQMIHDRILNWLVAEALAERRLLGEPTSKIIETLNSLLGVGDQALPNALQRRLGYVLMDLLWLLAQGQPAAILAEVVEGVLPAWRSQTHTGRFLEDLGGLGLSALPALELLCVRWSQDKPSDWRQVSLGRAIGDIARLDPAAAAPTIARLLTTAATERAGLEACIRTPAPSLTATLWALHMRHQRAFEAAQKSGWGDPRTRHLWTLTRVTFAAVVQAANSRTDWLGAEFAEANDAFAVEHLLYVLLETDLASARKIWRRSKPAILALIRPGTHAVAKAIGRFQDRDELARLEVSTPGADGLEPVLRLVSLLKLAPERAASVFATIRDEELGGASHMWLRRLLRAAPEAATAALLVKYVRGHWEDLRGLALAFLPTPDLVPDAIFAAMLDGYEHRLEAVDKNDAWRSTGETHLLRFLTQTVILAHLQALEGRQRLESLVVSQISRLPERQSLSRDLARPLYTRLLLTLGGAGLEQVVLEDLASAGHFGRIDGYRQCLFLPTTSALQAALTTCAASPKLRDEEYGDLIAALATHSVDVALMDLVCRTAAAFPRAIELRASLDPVPAALIAQLSDALASPEEHVRRGAVAALAHAPADQSVPRLARALNQVEIGSQEAETLIRLLDIHGAYDASTLPVLKTMAASGPHQSLAMRYLARHGDAEAKAAAAKALASLPMNHVHLSVGAVIALADHPGAAEQVIPLLRGALDDRLHRANAVAAASALLRIGAADVAEILETVREAGKQSPVEFAALLTEVAASDPAQAAVIAERAFVEAPSWPIIGFLVEAGGDRGLAVLLDGAQREARTSTPGTIGRGLRRFPDREQLRIRLEAMASSNEAAARTAAATLCGWQPEAHYASLLARLADEADDAVSDAALRALDCRARQAAGLALLKAVPGALSTGQWTRLLALVDLVDPGLLSEPGGPLALDPVLDTLPHVYRAVLAPIIEKRSQDLQKQEKRADEQAKAPY